eukprot:425417_1
MFVISAVWTFSVLKCLASTSESQDKTDLNRNCIKFSQYDNSMEVDVPSKDSLTYVPKGSSRTVDEDASVMVYECKAELDENAYYSFDSCASEYERRNTRSITKKTFQLKSHSFPFTSKKEKFLQDIEETQMQNALTLSESLNLLTNSETAKSSFDSEYTSTLTLAVPSYGDTLETPSNGELAQDDEGSDRTISPLEKIDDENPKIDETKGESDLTVHMLKLTRSSRFECSDNPPRTLSYIPIPADLSKNHLSFAKSDSDPETKIVVEALINNIYAGMDDIVIPTKRISTKGARSSMSSALSDNMVTPTPAEIDPSQPPTNISPVSRYKPRSRVKLPVIQPIRKYKPSTEIPPLKINAQYIPKLDSKDNESNFGDLSNAKPVHYAVRSEDNLLNTAYLGEDNIEYVSTPPSFSKQLPYIFDWVEPENVEIPTQLEDSKDVIHHTTGCSSNIGCGCCVL